MDIHESPGHIKRGVSLSPLCKLPRACVEGRSKGGNTGLPRWSLFSVLNRYLVETLIGALSTPIPRPKLKHGQKDDLTMRAGECGGKDYYFYDTNRIMLTIKQNRNCLTPCDFRELNGGAGEARTPDLRFRNLIDIPIVFVFNSFNLVTALLSWACLGAELATQLATRCQRM